MYKLEIIFCDWFFLSFWLMLQGCGDPEIGYSGQSIEGIGYAPFVILKNKFLFGFLIVNFFTFFFLEETNSCYRK